VADAKLAGNGGFLITGSGSLCLNDLVFRWQ